MVRPPLEVCSGELGARGDPPAELRGQDLFLGMLTSWGGCWRASVRAGLMFLCQMTFVAHVAAHCDAVYSGERRVCCLGFEQQPSEDLRTLLPLLSRDASQLKVPSDLFLRRSRDLEQPFV